MPNDKEELLKSMITNIIDDKNEEAMVDFHAYLKTKTSEVMADGKESSTVTDGAATDDVAAADSVATDSVATDDVASVTSAEGGDDVAAATTVDDGRMPA